MRKLIAYVPVATDEELACTTAEDESVIAAEDTPGTATEEELKFTEDVGVEITEEDIPAFPLDDKPETVEEEISDPDDAPAAEDCSFSAEAEDPPTAEPDAEDSGSSAEFEESEPQLETMKAKLKIEQKQKRRDIKACLYFQRNIQGDLCKNRCNTKITCKSRFVLLLYRLKARKDFIFFMSCKNAPMKKFTPFDFLDYRDYLRGFFEKRKEEAPWYSYKIFGDGVGLDQSQVFRILQKQLHISKKALPRFVSYLKLSPAEAKYFEKLVALGHSRKESETRALFSEVLALRGSKSKTLAGDEFELYSQWHHTVVRALLGIAHIKDDYEALGKMVTPPISATQAKKSVELLHRLGFVKRNDEGFWSLTDTSLTTGASYSSMFVRAYQAESMKLAVQSLDLHAKELRDISVVNMAVDESAFRDCQEILRAAREELRARIEKVEDPDRVMRLAIAFFPVAFASGGEKV